MIAMVTRVFLTAAMLAVTAAACGDARLVVYDKPSGLTCPSTPPANCPTSMVGYAAVGGVDADGGVLQPTNGGNDTTTPPVTVTNVADLTTELQRPEPLIIFLDGMLSPTATIKVTTDNSARGGNKTLIGVRDSSGLTGAGLNLGHADNIILRNLKISKVSIGEGDAVTLLDSHHIWVDHCDLSSERDNPTASYDGLVDITHGSSYVTVSWTLFHDHKDTSLVGHTSDLAQMAEDSALSVTYHHNLFFNVNSGPRVRFGNAHVFSNHFQTVTAFGVASESFATVQVDHNVFDDVPVPITTMYQDPNPGTMVEMSNIFPAGFTPDIMRPTDPVPPPYSFMSDAADSVATIVCTCAGTGKINVGQ